MKKIFLGVAVIIFLIIPVKDVKANVSGVLVSGKINDRVLEKIPETYELEINEIEFEQAEKILFQKIKEELKKENINIREANLNDFQEVFTFIDINIFDDLRKASIAVNRQDGSLGEKDISLVYKNSKDYNEKDKKEVEDVINNIDIPKNEENEFVIKNYVKLGEEMPEFSSYITNVLERKIKNKEVKVAYRIGYGDTNIFNVETRVMFNVFKNGVYYSDFYVAYECIYKIMIPEEIEDTEEGAINYALPIVKDYIAKYYKANGIQEEAVSEISLKKLSGNDYIIVDKQNDSFEGRKEKISLVKEISKVKEEKNNDIITNIKSMNWYLPGAIVIFVIITIIFIKTQEKRGKKNES